MFRLTIESVVMGKKMITSLQTMKTLPTIGQKSSLEPLTGEIKRTGNEQIFLVDKYYIFFIFKIYG